MYPFFLNVFDKKINYMNFDFINIIDFAIDLLNLL